MDTDDMMITIISSLLSGLVGVIVSSAYYRRFEHRKTKQDVLRRLVGNRMFLTDKLMTEKNRDLFVALNEIFVVYSDCPAVITALKKMHNELGQQNRLLDNLVSLIKEMCKASGVPFGKLNDNFIEYPFAPMN